MASLFRAISFAFFYELIIKDGVVRHGKLGAVFQDVTPVLAAGLKLYRTVGVVTSEVTPGDPAEKAGLRVRLKQALHNVNVA